MERRDEEEKKKTKKKRDGEADKVQVKVQGHLSPQSFITRTSPRDFKRDRRGEIKKEKKRQEWEKNRKQKIQLHPANQQPITKQNETVC